MKPLVSILIDSFNPRTHTPYVTAVKVFCWTAYPVGEVQARPWLESAWFQVLMLKKDKQRFQLEPLFMFWCSELAMRHYDQVMFYLFMFGYWDTRTLHRGYLINDVLTKFSYTLLVTGGSMRQG